MADRTLAIVKQQPVWMKQAEEARIKSEADTTAAAKAAFNATFKDVVNHNPRPDDSDSDGDDLAAKPPGPVDPTKCSAAGAGISGGAAGTPLTFVVVAKDSDDRKIPSGGAKLKVKISPGVGVGGSDQAATVKDNGDGTYSATYTVPKRGNYMVHVECDGSPIAGSPFPVFFSQGLPPLTPTPNTFPNVFNQPMPNYGLLGMIPAAAPSSSSGVVLQGIGSVLGEICREYMSGRCAKTDCKLSHPPHSLLMSALAATTTMGTLSHAPMAPSAAAMAAAQAIVAAQALQAHAAQMQAQSKSTGDAPGSPDMAVKADALKRTLQVSNLNPLLTVDQLKQLFSFCGTVVECSITDSRHFAYIEYSKPEEATAALAMNDIDVGGRPMNVEMAKSLPSKSALSNTSLPMMMQQAVAMQQMQFQQALVMQQTLVSQQAATRAATMKSATEMASARAAEISKKLKEDGLGLEDNDEGDKRKSSRSPSIARQRSKSRSRSPIKYHRRRRSRSFSPPYRYYRDRRRRSPMAFHHSNYGTERSYRDVRGRFSRGGRRERNRSRDRYSSVSRRKRSRSMSPRLTKSTRAGSISPKRHRESSSPRTKRSSRAGSRSPRHNRGGRSSPACNQATTSRRRSSPAGSRSPRRSRSRSIEGRHHSNEHDAKKSEKPKHSYSSSRSADGRHCSDNRDAKESENVMRRQSRSRSAEGRFRSYDKDVKKSENSKQVEDTKQDNRAASKDAKGSVKTKEDRTKDSSTVNHKRSSLLHEDETLKSERSTSRHTRSRMEDQNLERIGSAVKDRSLTGKASELNDVKRSGHSPTSRPHKRSSGHEDHLHSKSRDLSRHEKSNTSYKKHDSATREKGHIAGESGHSRDDRRSSHHSSSRSHRSSRHLEQRCSIDTKDRYKLGKPKDEYMESQYSVIKDSIISHDDRKVGPLDSPKMKSGRSSPPTTVDEVERDYKDLEEREMLTVDTTHSVDIETMTDKLDYKDGGFNLLGIECISNNNLVARNRSSMSEDHDTSCTVTDDRSQNEEAKADSEMHMSHNSLEYKDSDSQELAGIKDHRQSEEMHLSHNSPEYKDRDSRESTGGQDNNQTEEADMIKYQNRMDQGSEYFDKEMLLVKTDLFIDKMECHKNEFMGSANDENNTHSYMLNSSTLSPGNVEGEETSKVGLKNLAEVNDQEYITRKSSEPPIHRDVIPTEVCYIDYETWEKNDLNGCISKVATHRSYMVQELQSCIEGLDGNLESKDEGSDNEESIRIEESHPISYGDVSFKYAKELSNQISTTEVEGSNVEQRDILDASNPEGGVEESCCNAHVDETSLLG